MTQEGSRGATTGRATPTEGLLAQLLNTDVDEEYLVAAARTASPAAGPSNARRMQISAAVVTFGVLLGVSVIKTERDRPQALVERTQVIAQISARQTRLDRLHNKLRFEQDRVADLQTSVAALVTSASRLGGEADMLGVASGETAVHGPGVVVTADNAGDAVPGAGGIILDTDLQALVNGLWAAGAEAIAINGHRLSTMTAIRFAGQAITVDYRSLTPPYIVAAIGDPNTLPARFLETAGGQVWLGLRANFGIRFRTRTAERLELPGRPPDSLLWAHRVTSR